MRAAVVLLDDGNELVLGEIEEAGALLVRPDGVVAWRALPAARDAADAERQLRSALARILDQPSLDLN